MFFTKFSELTPNFAFLEPQKDYPIREGIVVEM